MINKRGFTLIELLIVVAIIAILAAIAVPNFLEAQTRAKVSRGKADMRTVATALETYAIDYSKYPFDIDPRGYDFVLTDIMTTPISYLTTANSLIDQFRPGTNIDARRYRFVNYPAHKTPAWPASPLPGTGPYKGRTVASDYGAKVGMEEFGMWKVSSSGPDKTAPTSILTDKNYYDATNGTVSGGDIILSQKGMKGN